MENKNRVREKPKFKHHSIQIKSLPRTIQRPPLIRGAHPNGREYVRETVLIYRTIVLRLQFMEDRPYIHSPRPATTDVIIHPPPPS